MLFNDNYLLHYKIVFYRFFTLQFYLIYSSTNQFNFSVYYVYIYMSVFLNICKKMY